MSRQILTDSLNQNLYTRRNLVMRMVLAHPEELHIPLHGRSPHLVLYYEK